MNHLKQPIKGIIDALLPRDSQKIVDLFLHWETVMGASLAKNLRPIRWMHDHNTFKLWIATPCEGAMDMRYHMPMVEQRLMAYLGQNMKIKILLEPLKHPKTPVHYPRPRLTPSSKTADAITDIPQHALRQAYARWYGLFTRDPRLTD